MRKQSLPSVDPVAGRSILLSCGVSAVHGDCPSIQSTASFTRKRWKKAKASKQDQTEERQVSSDAVDDASERCVRTESLSVTADLFSPFPLFAPVEVPFAFLPWLCPCRRSPVVNAAVRNDQSRGAPSDAPPPIQVGNGGYILDSSTSSGRCCRKEAQKTQKHLWSNGVETISFFHSLLRLLCLLAAISSKPQASSAA